MRLFNGRTRLLMILLALSLPFLPSCLSLTARVVHSQLSLGQNLSAGSDHACGITTAGELRCWGYNFYGQLKSPTPTASPFWLPPETYDSGVTYTLVTSGSGHRCGITATGALKCWGVNKNGQVGIAEPSGALTVVSSPQPIDSNESYTRISGGSAHTCGLTSKKAIRCWGWNSYGQLGNSNFDDQRAPVNVSDSDLYTEVSAGERHTCAIIDSGRVKCWGANDFGQVGNASLTKNSNTPGFVADKDLYSSVCAGSTHSCGVSLKGDLKCWGSNTSGQLGIGSYDSKDSPTPNTDGITYSQVACGSNHTCAITDSGQLRCWGSNSFGQLGLGITDKDQTSPTLLPIHSKGASITFKKLALGLDFSCAITSEGSAMCWGRNNYGQLGDGTENDSRVPLTTDSSKSY